MTEADSHILIRESESADVGPLCALLNEIILIGGTTALENVLSECRFTQYFLAGEEHICCLTAETENIVLGFQVLVKHADLPNDWADIATFVRRQPKVPGVGTALFSVTRELAAASGLAHINATIRADNAGGLAYYSKMGFQNYARRKNVPLASGEKVDRISKRFDIL